MKHAVIIHGYKGTPETNWKPWLGRELQQAGFAVDIPAMPDTDYPDATKWVAKLAEIIKEPSVDTFLIGHSLGCITILRYLENLAPGQKVGVCILVAGFGQRFQKYDGGHDTFFDHELNWREIKKHCGNFIAIHSEDDQNLEIEQMELLGAELSAKTIRINGMGHFGSADAVFEIPLVLDEVLKMSK